MVAKAPQSGKKWHFLTPNDRRILSGGPEPQTKRTYTGKGAERDRKRHLDRFNKVRREARLQARGALEDLRFLAESQDKDWLLETLGETRPVNVPPGVQRMVRLSGASPPPFTPLELLLQNVARKIAWEHASLTIEQAGLKGETHRMSGTFPEFFIERLTTALEMGLNATSGTKREIDVRLRSPPDLVREWEPITEGQTGVEPEKPV